MRLIGAIKGQRKLRRRPARGRDARKAARRPFVLTIPALAAAVVLPAAPLRADGEIVGNWCLFFLAGTPTEFDAHAQIRLSGRGAEFVTRNQRGEEFVDPLVSEGDTFVLSNATGQPVLTVLPGGDLVFRSPGGVLLRAPVAAGADVSDCVQ